MKKQEVKKLFGLASPVEIINQCTLSRFVLKVRESLRMIIEPVPRKEDVISNLLEINQIAARARKTFMHNNNLENRNGFLVEAGDLNSMEFYRLVDFFLKEIESNSSDINLMIHNMEMIDYLATELKKTLSPN